MAEVRKHNPTTNAIADAVRAAAGETIRPVTPGRDPEAPTEIDDVVDPYTAAPVADDAPSPHTSTAAGGFIGPLPDSLFTVPKPPAKDDAE